MTDAQFASEWTLCHQDLTEYARRAAWSLKSTLDPIDIISECYLYCHSARHQISESVPLEAIAKHWIKQNLVWTNSPLRARLAVSDAPAHKDSSAHPNLDPEQVIKEWVAKLSPYEQGLWSLWHTKGLRKGKEVSGYLDVSISSAYLVLKECRELEHRLFTYIKTTQF